MEETRITENTPAPTDEKETKPERFSPFYTIGEEIFNAVTHGVGALLGVAACAVLIVKAAISGGAIEVVSSAVYGASLILLYAMSTLYHSLTNHTAKYVFRIFDHCTIYLLIAGTYTPYALCSLGGWRGWTVFGVLWGLTALCVTLNAVNLEKFKVFSMICYIAMGWCIVLFIKPVALAIGAGGMWLLFAGGVLYTAGLLFFRRGDVRYMHSIWHLFVLAGSILHYFSILFYVIP